MMSFFVCTQYEFKWNEVLFSNLLVIIHSNRMESAESVSDKSIGTWTHASYAVDSTFWATRTTTKKRPFEILKQWMLQRVSENRRLFIRNFETFHFQQLEVELTEWKQISINMIINAHKTSFSLFTRKRGNTKNQRRTVVKWRVCMVLFDLEMVAQKVKSTKTKPITFN